MELKDWYVKAEYTYSSLGGIIHKIFLGYKLCYRGTTMGLFRVLCYKHYPLRGKYAAYEVVQPLDRT